MIITAIKDYGVPKQDWAITEFEWELHENSWYSLHVLRSGTWTVFHLISSCSFVTDVIGTK